MHYVNVLIMILPLKCIEDQRQGISLSISKRIRNKSHNLFWLRDGCAPHVTCLGQI